MTPAANASPDKSLPETGLLLSLHRLNSASLAPTGLCVVLDKQRIEQGVRDESR
jgi:hypothetical protein